MHSAVEKYAVAGASMGKMEVLKLGNIWTTKKISEDKVRSNTWTLADSAARYVQLFCFPHKGHQDLAEREFE